MAASRAIGQTLLKPTPGSALGPFYPVDRLAENDADLVWLKGHDQRALGDVIEVSGRILDMHGNPISGAALDIWQANAAGRYAHAGDTSDSPLDPNFQGFARLKTGADGEWRINTIRPGAYRGRTRHLHFDVSGQSHRLIAQMYLPEEAEANAKDGLYASLRNNAARSVATAVQPDKYRWDIVLFET